MDEQFMREALVEAKKAADFGEVPVGAVVVKDGVIVGRGHNERERNLDPAGHAEIAAMRDAAAQLGNWRLTDCTLYVTLEPCAMCTGAAIGSRIAKIVYGAADRERGTCGSVANLCHMPLGFSPLVRGGVLQAECEGLLQTFFASIR